MISQVYGGGGNPGAVYKSDFIELFNPGPSAVSLAGWSVQYTSASGGDWQVTDLTPINLLPRQYYLVQEASGAVGVDVPPPDSSGPIQMDEGAGKVALVRSTSPLLGACPNPIIFPIEDFVGYGPTTTCFEGLGPAPAPSNTISDWRKVNGCQDTNQNVNDFLTGVPEPRNTSVFGPCTTVQFSDAGYSVNEGGGSVTITVTRSGETGVVTTVDYDTSDGTAEQRSDYILASGTLTFAAGETSKTFTVLIEDDVYVEGPETVKLTLSNPSNAGYGIPDSFPPLYSSSAAVLTIIDNDTSAPTVNPLDTRRRADPEDGFASTVNGIFFVTQHYYDFLSRVPDAGGLAFWTNEITSCGTDQVCIQLKRINVSAAYFLSIEFQQTGYLVERIYKAAYGDANGSSTFGAPHQLPAPVVRYSEFMPDTQRIGQGVVVGQTGWEQALENNKQNFTAKFVQRSRFSSALPTTMTPAQFVDKLNQNAGNVLSSSERTTAINLFGSATDTSNTTTRAGVLRQVAENSTLVTNEFNRAFVLMQFFGYLRRDPNSGQDTDYTGYDFWLTKLNQFNGNFVAAEMVKAFITSTEYRQRFGP